MSRLKPSTVMTVPSITMRYRKGHSLSPTAFSILLTEAPGSWEEAGVYRLL
ncbi:hypothetical protein PC116_g2673 [Phytophthora cactorum]|nr:hypothetical protein PC114_g5517 [Phytophthora cactorum]KAG3031924.1 hypothetical protein PC120_g2832 [Phytophthora cactorum]KAG4062163.1 hypothetical protein PC123_g2954 [Phytophthora cactorum]KAG4249559.1 hypothetical protein PC116_g2673 [Phytophthora cactorum]